MIPAYRVALEKAGVPAVVYKGMPVKLGAKEITADILGTEINSGIPVYLVRRDEFFDRSGIYGTTEGEYFDSRERFIFFSRSIPLLCRALGYHPDVVMANDWQTGLLMALLDQGSLPGATGIFTIHNLGYQGLVPPEQISLIGLPDHYYRMEGLEYYGQMSLLKAGIVYAHAVTTVSPTYAQEIQTREFGCGFEGLLGSIRERLFGIINGIDEREWDPEKDVHLSYHYSRKDLSGKALCKGALLKEMGLPMRLKNRPLLGMVSRLVSQKGCEHWTWVLYFSAPVRRDMRRPSQGSRKPIRILSDLSRDLTNPLHTGFMPDRTVSWCPPFMSLAGSPRCMDSGMGVFP